MKLLIIALIILSTAASHGRTWTSKGGKSLEGTLVKQWLGVLTIQRESNNKTFNIKLDALSEADKQYMIDYNNTLTLIDMDLKPLFKTLELGKEWKMSGYKKAKDGILAFTFTAQKKPKLNKKEKTEFSKINVSVKIFESRTDAVREYTHFKAYTFIETEIKEKDFGYYAFSETSKAAPPDGTQMAEKLYFTYKNVLVTVESSGWDKQLRIIPNLIYKNLRNSYGEDSKKLE